ncbi:uncharacterized protein MELLADRAFT_89002 [Melampsora larici-populina 98AG31]|uniref:Uncharacterized protein n=1 Tax=Melampsora larici-populina (strain 98AG31 / pathotype 3-4-7) TaxID=747676 RepID=F4R6L5_MELLP|nr:uncharacterized protein MELLADRAFT_89002 [Melampsora larici-populina 98AG31]EGG12442.1 hypothetical protein MELLADRAFT_89002 [Melampsora larici-populina 98AG31]
MAPSRKTTTRVSRSNPEGRSQPTDLPAAKRSRRQPPCARVNQSEDASASTDSNQLPAPSATQQTSSGTNRVDDEQDLELSKITLQNYHKAKTHWPLGRIEEQLHKQKSTNHQLSAAVISEGQALLQNLDHSLHMLAMVAKVSVIKLKRALGLLGGSHGENAWHQWLSFALAAKDIASHPDASNLLTARNQANSKTYQALDDDEYRVFTAPVFYALGGYPDYSAVTITDDVFGDSSILVPEVPKLSPEDEARYRPIYKDLVDLKKVAKDQELNTPAASSQKEERRSLQCFKKTAQQANYYIIACSNSDSGNGWCREYTSRNEMADWVSKKAQFQTVFPLYCQHGSTFDAIKEVLAGTKNTSVAQAQKPKNQSDIDKHDLRSKLNEMLKDVVGEARFPTRGFPQVPNPLEAIKDRQIPVIVERATDCTLSMADFNKGFTAMDTKARRNWLSDIRSGKFKLKLLELPGSSEGQPAGGTTQSEIQPAHSATQPAHSATQPAQSETQPVQSETQPVQSETQTAQPPAVTTQDSMGGTCDVA